MASKIITAHFTNNGVPTTGLTPLITINQLDPLSSTSYNTVVSSAPMVDVSLGWYRYDFSSYDPTGSYVLLIDGGSGLSSYERYKVGGNESYTEDISSGVWEEPTTTHTTTDTMGMALNQIYVDVASIALNDITLANLLNTLLKYERNRTRIDTDTQQLIIYDDDGTTPLTTFNLLDFSGMPSVQEVCERVPVI